MPYPFTDERTDRVGGTPGDQGAHAADHNQHSLDINSIKDELGDNPKGGDANVEARLDRMEAATPATSFVVVDTKGDLIVGTADDTVDNLPVGADGQVLTADSTNATFGVKWANPASVSGVAASTYDAKGDLLPGTGNDAYAKLPVGTDGQVLVADSSQTTGLKWGTIGTVAVTNRPVHITVGHVSIYPGADFVYNPSSNGNPGTGGFAGQYNDAAKAINAALRSIAPYQGGVSGDITANGVEISAGVFDVKSPISVDSGVHLYGQGRVATRLNVVSSFSNTNPAGSGPCGVIQPWYQADGSFVGGHIEVDHLGIDFTGAGLTGIHGIVQACKSAPGFLQGVDPYWKLSQLHVQMTGSSGAHGIYTSRPSGWYLIREMKVDDIRVSGASTNTGLGWGCWFECSDSFFDLVTVNGMSMGGIFWMEGNQKIGECGAFYCGNGGSTLGPGMLFGQNPAVGNTDAANRSVANGLGTQDNWGNGIEVQAGNVSILGFISDSNGGGTDATSAGVLVSASRVQLYGQVMNRGGGRGTSTSAVYLVGTPQYVRGDIIMNGGGGTNIAAPGTKGTQFGTGSALNVVG